MLTKAIKFVILGLNIETLEILWSFTSRQIQTKDTVKSLFDECEKLLTHFYMSPSPSLTTIKAQGKQMSM